MADKGWIALHRSIRDHWLYQEKRVFSKYEAWLDILMDANHQKNKIVFDGQLFEVERGQRVTSIRQLAERWGWSRHKVADFLELLERDSMVATKRDSKKTLITVLNYDSYQSDRPQKSHQKSHQPDIKRATEEPQTDTNNNDNNENNDKQINNDVDDVKGVDIYQTYQEVFGVLNPLMSQNLEQWAEDLTPELVNEALIRSGTQGAKKFSYTEVILRNWEKEGVKTVEDIAALDAKREKNNRKPAPAKKPQRESNSGVSF